MRIAALYFICLLAVPACSSPSGAEGDASTGDASDAPDVPCPSMMPIDRSACPVGGQACWFDEGGISESMQDGMNDNNTSRCDCVSPEMQWVCCNLSTPWCPNLPNDGRPSDGGFATPASVVGAVMQLSGRLCCAADVHTIGAGWETTISCPYYPCIPPDGSPQVTCSYKDRHWRFSYTTCAPWMENPWGDASADAAPDDATTLDAGTPDASADSPDGGG